MIVIGIILMLVMFGGMIGGLLYVLKKSDPKKVDTSLRSDIETAQEFLPFTDIQDSMIHMGHHNYRAIVEVSSINYDLKTEKEQRVIEMSYTQFLNSLMFPITIFISTKEMDNRQYMKDLQEDYEAMLVDYPDMVDYANANLNDMMTLNYQLGTTRQKKKYVIIPYDEANELSMQSDEEKYEHSAKELATRSRIIQEGLLNLGIQTRVLKTPDILELMIATYHRDGFNYSDEVWNKNYLSMIVEGERNYFNHDFSEADSLEVFKSEFEEKVKTAILGNEDVSQDIKDKAHDILLALKGEKRVVAIEEPEIKTESAVYEDEDEDEDDVDDFIQPHTLNWQGAKKDEMVEN